MLHLLQVIRVLILSSRDPHIWPGYQGRKRTRRRRQRKRTRDCLLFTISCEEGYRDRQNQGPAAWTAKWMVAGIAGLGKMLVGRVSVFQQGPQVWRKKGMVQWQGK